MKAEKMLDYSLIDQIERHRSEIAAAEWQEKVTRAKRIGSMQAKAQFAAIVFVLLLALILIPAPSPR